MIGYRAFLFLGVPFRLHKVTATGQAIRSYLDLPLYYRSRYHFYPSLITSAFTYVLFRDVQKKRNNRSYCYQRIKHIGSFCQIVNLSPLTQLFICLCF